MSLLEPDAVEHIPAEAASTYTKLADRYGQEYYESVADDVANRLEPCDRLLDVGTGPGFLPLAVAERVDAAHLDAFDVTRELVAHGRAQAVQCGIHDRVSFFIADCYTIPVVAHSYSFLTCTGVLHALDRPAQALSEFYRVLEPGGEAWVFDPVIIDVPDSPVPELTEHEQEVFQAYGVRSDDDEPALPQTDAEPLVDASPFKTTEVRKGDQGDTRLFLTREE